MKPDMKSKYYDVVPISVTDFIIDYTASMTTVRFRHKLPVLDMKPDVKSKYYDVASISS
jgi:hypothetical protein